MKSFLITLSVLTSFTLTSWLLAGCNSQLPFLKGNGESVKLVNNSGAYDRTWDEVVRFLIQDNTDSVPYTKRHNSFNFAEELHNKAEYYGFKTAFVIVTFENGDSYALNAFRTIDLGLIYVDSTGEGNFDSIIKKTMKEYTEATTREYVRLQELKESWAFEPRCSAYLQAALEVLQYRDKVAYVAEGKKMGFISAEFTGHDFSYEHFLAKYAQLGTFIIRSLKQAIDSAVLADTVIHRLEWGQTKHSADEATKEARSEEQLSKEWVDKVLVPEWKKVRPYDWEMSDDNVKSTKIYW